VSSGGNEDTLKGNAFKDSIPPVRLLIPEGSLKLAGGESHRNSGINLIQPRRGAGWLPAMLLLPRHSEAIRGSRFFIEKTT
jgi:hypothetical protein